MDRHFLTETLVSRDASKKIPIPLEHLKTVRLFYVCLATSKEVSYALFLLGNSPNLQKLQIEVSLDENADLNSTHDFPEAEDYFDFSLNQLQEAEDYFDFSLNQLQEVNLQNIGGSRAELKFVKLLLAKSSVRKTMRLQYPKKMSREEQLKVLKETTRFPRASTKAEIIYEDFVEDRDDILRLYLSDFGVKTLCIPLFILL